MAIKKIYKTVFSVTVLTEEPIPDDFSLDQVIYESNYGELVAVAQEEKSESVMIKGRDAINTIYSMGSEPEFFMMDRDGNEIEYDV